MTEVTISIPVTARFDGCFCSDECEHMSWASTGAEICSLYNDYCKYLGAVRRETYLINPSIPIEQRHSFVRTRWCCETFGMGEAKPTEPLIWTNIDGSTVDLTQNVIDNETLRRCTFDE